MTKIALKLQPSCKINSGKRKSKCGKSVCRELSEKVRANFQALSISYPPKQHPPAPESARTVRFYILYFAFFSRVRSALPAFAGLYSSIQVPAFITSAQHTSDTECCFKNMVESTISTVRPRQTFRNTGRFLNCSLCSTATATATELYT